MPWFPCSYGDQGRPCCTRTSSRKRSQAPHRLISRTLDTIKSSSDISILFSEGRRVKTPDVMVIIKRNEKQHDPRGRVAFIAGKKLGNAVWRNRAKRRMRALCKDLNGPFPGYDVIFLARSSVSEADYGNMLSNLRKALVREKILQ